MEISLVTIETATKRFAAAHADLAASVAELNESVERLKRGALPRFKREAAALAERRNELAAQIAGAPGIFESPRTLVMHGIRIGFQKGKGKIVFGDPDQVVRLIEKHFPDQTDVLLHIKKTPNKKAIVKLPAGDLKRLGCEVTDAGTEIVIRPVAGDAEKLINALFREFEQADKLE